MCTGLEPLLAGMGASAGVASLGATALGSLGAGLLGKALMPQQPAVQVAAPVTPPQAAKTPDMAAITAKTAAATMPGGTLSGNSGTFLTGPSGIDPTSLNLGKNTLLGQ